MEMCLKHDIKVDNISKIYGTKIVLENFSATFPAGRISCIMGRSGCGKTTLLNIILGTEKPDGGQISGVPKRVSAVFQENRLCEDFSVETNIKITCAKGVTPGDIARALGALGLGENIRTPVRELSGGMKRRVAIARAMLADGSLIIMDEPFRELDDTTRAAAAVYVRENLRGRTLIAVTHAENDATALGAARIIRMSGSAQFNSLE